MKTKCKRMKFGTGENIRERVRNKLQHYSTRFLEIPENSFPFFTNTGERKDKMETQRAESCILTLNAKRRGAPPLIPWPTAPRGTFVPLAPTWRFLLLHRGAVCGAAAGHCPQTGSGNPLSPGSLLFSLSRTSLHRHSATFARYDVRTFCTSPPSRLLSSCPPRFREEELGPRNEEEDTYEDRKEAGKRDRRKGGGGRGQEYQGTSHIEEAKMRQQSSILNTTYSMLP